MRLTQSLIDPDELRLVCYVDNPLAAIRGTPERRRLLVTLLILVWNGLGFKLTFKKGQLGQVVTWIGITVTIEIAGIRAKVKQEIIDDIIADLKRFRQSPEFKLLIEDLGSQDYWRSRGIPPQCRALGEDDFECDQALSVLRGS